MWQCVVHIYKVCINSIITQESIAAWNLYNRLDGFNRETYTTYQTLPAKHIEQFEAIEAEMSRISIIRQREKAAKK